MTMKYVPAPPPRKSDHTYCGDVIRRHLGIIRAEWPVGCMVTCPECGRWNYKYSSLSWARVPWWDISRWLRILQYKEG